MCTLINKVTSSKEYVERIIDFISADLFNISDYVWQKQEKSEEMAKKESCGFKKQVRGRFWNIFHIADACYNFNDKTLDWSEKKTED